MRLPLDRSHIHKAVGTDGRRDPERILRVLHEIGADVVALQEVDRRFGLRAGVLPRLLRLYYLRDREILDYRPDVAELEAIERQVEAIAAAIVKARETGDWRPTPHKLCDWCAHQAICPAFGGTPPPLPERVVLPDDDATAVEVAER